MYYTERLLGAYPGTVDDEDATHEGDVLPDLRLSGHGRNLADLCGGCKKTEVAAVRRAKSDEVERSTF